jgi:hypothetical protein
MDREALALNVLAHFVPGDKVLEFLAPESDWLDIRYCAEDDDRDGLGLMKRDAVIVNTRRIRTGGAVADVVNGVDAPVRCP